MIVPEIVGGVLSVLLPYVIKGAEKFAEEAGKDAYAKAKSLFATLKAKWSGDPEAAKALEDFEQKPARYQPVLRSILEEKLAGDEGLRDELARRLQEMKPYLHVIQEMKVGKGVIGADFGEVASGKVDVEQKIEQAENVTGIKANKVG
jgi:hypothetical protein